MRYLEARMRDESDDGPERAASIPLPGDDDDPPATLVSPLEDYPGVWTRRSSRHARPAVYVRIAAS